MQIISNLFTVVGSFFNDFGVWCTTRGDSNLAVGGLALGMSIAYFFEAVIGFVLLKKVKKNLVTWKDTIGPLFVKLLNALIMAVRNVFCI